MQIPIDVSDVRPCILLFYFLLLCKIALTSKSWRKCHSIATQSTPKHIYINIEYTELIFNTTFLLTPVDADNG